MIEPNFSCDPRDSSAACDLSAAAASADSVVAVWKGELLWPTALPIARVIDARAVTHYGVWVWNILRAHPGVAIVADENMRDAIVQAQVPVRWFRDIEQALAGPSAGVTASERSLLWE